VPLVRAHSDARIGPQAQRRVPPVVLPSLAPARTPPVPKPTVPIVKVMVPKREWRDVGRERFIRTCSRVVLVVIRERIIAPRVVRGDRDPYMWRAGP